MATFQYAGVQAGKKINGVISASDPKAAASELRKKKIIVTSIKKGNGKSDAKGPPSLDDIPISNAPIIFSKEETIQSITNQLNEILEEMILNRPEQWIWSHNRWK